MPERREALRAGTGLLATSMLGGGSAGARAATEDTSEAPTGGTRSAAARAWGATSATSPLGPLEITRRAVGPRDVLLDVLYCGVCHSDIHTARGEWGPTPYPCVPGHEIVGRVRAVGHAVTKFKVGDIGGVGCMVDSCRTCEHCTADLEQYCLNGNTQTYGSPDKVSGGHTLGGYFDALVVSEHFVIRIPPGANLAATAPLLCAAVTTFSPMQHWKLQAGRRAGVIGLGGLGHIAVKLAAARGADVTVFTTSPGKLADARRLGATEAVLSTDADAMRRQAGRFDLLISTVPQGYAVDPFLDLLRLDGTLVNVGARDELRGVRGAGLWRRRRSVASSVIGGIAETQEVIDYCAARGISADVEVIRPEDLDRAWERVVNKDVRYRFVIDVARAKREG